MPGVTYSLRTRATQVRSGQPLRAPGQPCSQKQVPLSDVSASLTPTCLRPMFIKKDASVISLIPVNSGDDFDEAFITEKRAVALRKGGRSSS